MDPTRLDFYCERSGPGLWAEPLNALTNLAFVLAALALFLRLRRSPGGSLSGAWDLWVLASLILAIGVGSGLWHTFATPWAAAADVLPIMLFINVYLLSFLVRMAGQGLRVLFLAFLGFQALSVLNVILLPAGLLNGSVAYLPAYLALLALTAYLHASRSPLRAHLAWASALFSLSLVFRTLDNVLCAALPLGIHFLWHLMNALLLFILVTALILKLETGSEGRATA